MLHSHVVIDQVSKFSKGYGFVLYSNHEEARHAISELNGLTIRDKILKVSFARPASEDIQDSKIHVSNIPPFLEEEALISVFKSVSCIVMYFPSWWWGLHCYSNCVQFGAIIECNVLKGNRGVAFIQFNNRAEAENGKIDTVRGS